MISGAFRTPVEINLHSVLHVGRVKKPFSHLQASLPWKKAFYPDIIKLILRGTGKILFFIV